MSLVLYVAHKSLAADGSLGLRVCSATSDCATVLRHPRAVLWGLPLAAWGILYFAGMGAAVAIFGLPRRRSASAWPVLAGAAVGTGVSAACLYWMGGVIGAWCPWCLSSHAVNFLMCGLIAWRWARRQKGTGTSRWDEPVPLSHGKPPVGLSHDRTHTRRVGIALGAWIVVGILLVFLSADIRQAHARLHGPRPDAIEEITAGWRTSPHRPIQLVGDELVLGTPPAAHTLVMFTDLCCPYCRQVHEHLGELLDRRPDLRVAIKQFPFHPSCNPAVEVARARYARSCQAAWVVQAAGAASQTSPSMLAVAEGVLAAEAPDGLDDEGLLDIVRQAGLDGAAWSRRYQSDAVRRRVDLDIAEGRRLGVRTVPAFFLDGKALTEAFVYVPGSGEVDWERTDALWRELLGR